MTKREHARLSKALTHVEGFDMFDTILSSETFSLKRLCLAIPLASLALCAACASTPSQTEPDSTATATTATSEPAPTPSSEPATTPSATPTSEPTASVRPPSGRTPLVLEKPEKVTGSFGETPPAKLVVTAEKAFFRIPEYALSESSVNVTFSIDKKAAKKAKGGAGSVYRLQAQVPPAEAFSTVTTRGPKFELRLPTAKVATPNLAIGEPKKDAKGKDTIEWKVIASTKVEDGMAVFELTEFADAYLQVTSEAPQ